MGRCHTRHGIPRGQTELGFKIEGPDNAGQMFPCLEIYGKVLNDRD